MKKAWLVCAVLIYTLRLAAQTNEMLRVAVLDDPAPNTLSSGLADFIEAGLEKEGVAAYDRRFLRALLAERGLDRSGFIDLKTMSAAKLPAMDVFVRGGIQLVGTNHFALTLESVRATDAVILDSLHAEGRYPQEWLPSLER